jgi:hypothetical protein
MALLFLCNVENPFLPRIAGSSAGFSFSVFPLTPDTSTLGVWKPGTRPQGGVSEGPIWDVAILHPPCRPRIDKPVTFFFEPATNTYERRIKMKNIGKITIAALLAMFLVAWASPSEAWNGRARSVHRNHYKNNQGKQYSVHRNRRVRGHHHYYPNHRYSHYRSHYKPRYYRYGHYSHFGLRLSPHGTRIHIGLGF